MTTYDDFEAQLRRTLEEPVEGVWKDASLMYWTNEITSQLARRNKPADDEVYSETVSGTWSYDLPDDTLEVRGLYVDGVAIPRIDIGDIGTLDQTVRGKPSAFLLKADELILSPTPDAVYPVRLFRYRSTPTITLGTDLMPFDGEYNTAIEYGVLNRCFEQIADWQTAEMYRGRFEAAVDEMLRQKIMEKGALRSSSPREVY